MRLPAIRSVPKPIATGAPLAAEVTERSPRRGPERLAGAARGKEKIAQDRAGEPAGTGTDADGGAQRGTAGGDEDRHQAWLRPRKRNASFVFWSHSPA